jgi:hypothetical protein
MPGSGGEGMRVEHPAEHDVDEEALGFGLRVGQVAVLEVGGDHAPVVGPVPGAGGGVVGERRRYRAATAGGCE